MSVPLAELVRRADELLQPALFQDYCPNGLQVEGCPRVGLLVSGVTASQALLEAAVAARADAILVHHGYFWRGEPAVVTGIRRRRLGLLLNHDISLLAYHLPLDAHPELGNNAQLARQLGFEITGGLQPEAERPIGNVGRVAAPLSAEALARHVAQRLGREPLLIKGGEHPVRTIAWCSGGAQGYIEQAAALGVDAFLSGEISEQTVHLARELGLHYLAAGHHATERFGAPALAAHLAAVCGIEHRFIDIENPA
jgi:dinuclear metal center YbgI/SA1388 family protein